MLSLSVSDHGISLKDTITELIINDHSQRLEDASPQPDSRTPPQSASGPGLSPKSADLRAVRGACGQTWGSRPGNRSLG